MARQAIVVGGSIAGLFAATMLRRAGWHVTVLERATSGLSGRGAGIVTHDRLTTLLSQVGATTEDLGVAVQERVVFDRAGEVVTRLRMPQVVTSWDRIHSLLRALLPEGSYQPGRIVTGYRCDGAGVAVQIEGAGTAEADLLVGADGFRSAVRAQMAPAIQPRYAGYVVWRALANEADLPPRLRATVFPHFGLYLPEGTQIVGYPIAGRGNDLRPGHRRYNFVWYLPADLPTLHDMLTDATGRRHALSIPPPLVRDDVVARAAAAARRLLPPPFVNILARSERPFFTPIYDHLTPRFCDGPVALLGDAACVARPHVGMGVTKAACDAEALARHLGAGGSIAAALDAYDAERRPAARIALEAGQWLGAMIFTGADSNADGRANANLDVILRRTATVPAG